VHKFKLLVKNLSAVIAAVVAIHCGVGDAMHMRGTQNWILVDEAFGRGETVVGPRDVTVIGVLCI
jgi:hypothetical protein